MKKILIIIPILLILIGGPVMYIIITKNQESRDVRTKAQSQTALSLLTSKDSYDVDDAFEVQIKIDTEANVVYESEIKINYDSEKITAEDLTAGTFFDEPVISGKQINASGGYIKFTIYTTQAQAKSGSGILAKISFKAIQPGTTELLYDVNGTDVFGLDPERTEVLKSTNRLNLTITGSQSSTPTPVATLSLTPTVSMSPTPTFSSNCNTNNKLAITYPAENALINNPKPQISGTSTALSTVTITITGNTTTTMAIEADSCGHWSYTPSENLTEGTQNIILTEQTTDGEVLSATHSFNINSQSVPTTGSMTFTYILFAFGAGLFLLGLKILIMP